MNGLFKKIITNHNFLSLANNGLVAVFGFVSFVMLVRMLPQEVFGEWVLFITMGNFIDMFRFGITRTALTRFLSSADEKEAKSLMGSNNLINLISTVGIAIVIFVIYLIFKDSIKDSGFAMFFIWYPLYSFLSLPFNNAQAVLQAQFRFDSMLWLRMVNVGIFMLFLAANFFLKIGIQGILIAYMVSTFISSAMASLLNWDGIRYMFNATRAASKTILDFGKYTTGTLIGSNMLRSADAFIIGLSPFLGTTGVALYSIPLKLTEIIEIPLRSFAATAFPALSKASIDNDNEKVRYLFYLNAGGTTLLLIPVMIFCFIFAEQIVFILGGSDYLITANIFRMFCVYGLFLPLDRFIGVTLDSVNRPKQNFIKVIYMATSNIVGDLIAVFGFSGIILGFSWGIFVFGSEVAPAVAYDMAHAFAMIKTLELVAFVSILFTIIGIVVGYKFLNETLDLRFRDILRVGYSSGILIAKQILLKRH
ncbi:MAG: oligosaccharide flippase family protein [Bacteroidales bacterium]|nr:oligosaccharide flippase family protein [Bacteroidales bacterium]